MIMTRSICYCALTTFAGPELLVMLIFLGIGGVAFLLMENSAKKHAREKYASYTGRKTVRIQTREMVETVIYKDEKGRDVCEDKCFVTYEFYVDGRRYEGSSESSDSELDKNEQVICYDPNDPNNNCTLWYLEKQTNSHFFG